MNEIIYAGAIIGIWIIMILIYGAVEAAQRRWGR